MNCKATTFKENMASILNILITLTNLRKGISRSMSSFVVFLEDSNSPSTEKYIGIIKDRVHQKCFCPWDELGI